jgi:thiol-disulfide isomerase/thioredoxin
MKIRGRIRWARILALAAISFVGCSRRTARQKPVVESVRAGEPGSTLPKFTVKDFQGNELSSSQLRGKVAIVDFWATWCEPCKREMPGYQHLLDRYGPQGLAVVGFKATMMMDTEDPIRFAQKAGVHYPLAVGSPAIVEKFGGLQGLPTTFIYDRQGILRRKIIGFEYTANVEKMVVPLLNAARR